MDICIVGSGFAGLCMGIQLKKAGIDSFVILEKADNVGGTWRDNTYPGAACDVPSHLYSFSFEPNHDWSRKFSPQPEIQAYLEHCAEKYELMPHIRFDTEVSAAKFDASLGRWSISTQGGDTLHARVLVPAVGQLSRPAYPSIPGLEDFPGSAFHSARWDHDYDLEGKTVAVVGTGASAIQFVPQIARTAKRVHVFQRSAPWILPKPDRAFAGIEHKLFHGLPGFERAYRGSIYCTMESRAVGFQGFTSLLKFVGWQATRHLKRWVKDPELREALTPDYTIGCKRVLLSNDYYEAMVRENVNLVTSSIDRIEGDTILTADGTRQAVDAIIFGTGFKASEFLAPMEIAGLGGRELNEEWVGGAEAYKGISVAGFPNLFMLYGPNTGLAHNSIVYMIESQVSYIMDCLRTLEDRPAAYLDVRRDVQTRYNEWIQSEVENSPWQDCQSWYRAEGGKNTANWPGFTFAYRAKTRRVNLADYELHEAAWQSDSPRDSYVASSGSR
jgi:cation diffusion facilitator CzcD-associated flavoprotein CzcO